jgi:hypothetical protein
MAISQTLQYPLRMSKPTTSSVITRCACALFLTLSTTGCATFFTGAGKTQSVKIASNPRGAQVYVDDSPTPIGPTPTIAPLTRHDDHTIKLVLNGYETQTIQIKTGPNWWVLGDLIPYCGGLIGAIIDLADGSLRGRLSPSNIEISLTPTPPK